MKNSYRIFGDLTVVYIKHKGRFLQTIIDTVDLRRVASIRGTWFARHAGNNKFYVFTSVKGETVHIHRYITGAPQGLVVDHIDGDAMNNRRKTNLRLATHGENMQNRQSANRNSTTKIRGVCWHKKSRKWQVRVNIDGVQSWVGAFEILEDAEQAAIESRTKHYAFSKENLGRNTDGRMNAI
mgnify:CR=1 FL=1